MSRSPLAVLLHSLEQPSADPARRDLDEQVSDTRRPRHEIVHLPLSKHFRWRGHRFCSTVDNHAPACLLVLVEVVHLKSYVGGPYQFGEDSLGRGAEVHGT